MSATLLVLSVLFVSVTADFDLNDPIQLEIAKQFSRIGYNPTKKQLATATSTSPNDNIQNFLKKSTNYIDIHIEDENLPQKIELMSQFLAAKIAQNIEKINLMSIPELRVALETAFKIVKFSQTETLKIQDRIGSTSCKLEKIQDSRFDKKVPVCSWHWDMVERENRFPSRRGYAKCNCDDCQARVKI